MMRSPGVPTQQRGPSLGHPGAAAPLFLAAARCGDKVVFIPVNRPPGCRCLVARGVPMLLVGSVGLALSSPAHAAAPQGAGAPHLQEGRRREPVGFPWLLRPGPPLPSHAAAKDRNGRKPREGSGVKRGGREERQRSLLMSAFLQPAERRHRGVRNADAGVARGREAPCSAC